MPSDSRLEERLYHHDDRHHHQEAAPADGHDEAGALAFAQMLNRHRPAKRDREGCGS